MPLVRKRQREEETAKIVKEQAKRRKICKEFTEFENVGYQNDHWHSVFRSIPENIEDVKNVLARFIGSFINGDGGILCFGVRKTGVIYGEQISRKEEDVIRLLIDEIFKKMHPHVSTDKYRVTFTPVLGSSFRRQDGVKESTKLQVLEIRVAAGDPFSLYEDHKHEVFLRKGDAPYGPLTPHEIKRHTVQQLRNQLKSQKDMAKLFDTPEKSWKIDKENLIMKDEKSSTKKKRLSSSKQPLKPSSLLVSKKSSTISSQRSKSPSRPSSRSASRKNSNRSSKSPPSRPSSHSSSRKNSNRSSKSPPSRPSSRSSSRKSQSRPSKSPPPKQMERGSSKSPSKQPSSHQSSKSPAKTNLSSSLGGKVIPGSSKQFPFILSSGESDHEVPLPSVPAQKKPKSQPLQKQEKVHSAKKSSVSEPSLPSQSSEKPGVKPFVVKRVASSTLSLANPLNQTKEKKKLSNCPSSASNGPSSASNGPPSASNGLSSTSNGPSSASNGPISTSNGLSSTVKQPPVVKSVAAKKCASSASSQARPASKVHPYSKPVSKPPPIHPPPPPPQSIYYNHLPPPPPPPFSTHGYAPATGHQYYLRNQHHSLLSQRYHEPHYPPTHHAGYSRAHPIPAHHHHQHPLTTSYSAPYYTYNY